MKRLLYIVAILLLPTSVAFAAPWLTCDCTPEADKVTGFTLQFGTQPAIDIPAAECDAPATARKKIWYDLGTLPNGPFSVKASAKNLWGSSAYTDPLADTKQLPTSPLLLKIAP